MTAEGHYIGLYRGASPMVGVNALYAAHNARVPADRQADVCNCTVCAGEGPLDMSTGPRDPGPAVVAFPAAGPARRRGPVQDESGALDPVDAAAMRAVEGCEIADELMDAPDRSRPIVRGPR